MPTPRIRPMTPADVEPVAAAFLRENWGDRRLNLEFVTAHPETRPFVADAGGRVVGTSVLSINGTVGWIGTVWVDPAWRRRGIGLDLTRATIDEAEAAGCRTLVLVATEAGRPLYERLGFEVQTWYRILQIDGLDGAAADPARPALPCRGPGRDGCPRRRGHRRGPGAPARVPSPLRTRRASWTATTARSAGSSSARRGAAGRRSRRGSRTPRRSSTPGASRAARPVACGPGSSPRTRRASSGWPRSAGPNRGGHRGSCAVNRWPGIRRRSGASSTTRSADRRRSAPGRLERPRGPAVPGRDGPDRGRRRGGR